MDHPIGDMLRTRSIWSLSNVGISKLQTEIAVGETREWTAEVLSGTHPDLHPSKEAPFTSQYSAKFLIDAT